MSFYDINPATVAYNGKLKDDYGDAWQWVRRYRMYDQGYQPSQLNADQRATLGGRDGYNLNVCGLINRTEVDRLNVRGIRVSLPDANDDVNDRLTELFAKWWRQSRMDEQQKNAYYAAARDGDSYLIVGWRTLRNGNGHPVLAVNEKFDGETGTEVEYSQEDFMSLSYATKVWVGEHRGNKGNRVLYRNVYGIDELTNTACVVRQKGSGGLGLSNWQPRLAVAEEPTRVVIAGQVYTGGVDFLITNGVDMGVPVFHLRHSANGMLYGESNLSQIVPDVQDQINMANTSYMAAAMLDGFRIMYVIGPEQEGTLQRWPGTVWNIETPEGTGASVGVLEAAALDHLVQVVDKSLMRAAMLTSTNMPFLNPSSMLPAEGTLRQMEIGLVKKCEANQVAYGNAYEDAARMMFRFAIQQGVKVGITIAQVDDLIIDINWDDTTNASLEHRITTAQNLMSIGVNKKSALETVGLDALAADVEVPMTSITIETLVTALASINALDGTAARLAYEALGFDMPTVDQLMSDTERRQQNITDSIVSALSQQGAGNNGPTIATTN